MGATYTRQSTYTDGDVIQAADTNDEFDQLVAVFNESTGHTHDGTSQEGGPITKLLGNTLTFGAGTAGTDVTVTFDGETNDGELKWMEDEDYFEFSDDILIASAEKIQFRDTAISINSSTDGQLDIVADTLVQVATAAFTVDASGDITLDAGGADVVLKDDGTTFGSLTNSSGELVIKSGSTPTAALTFSGANVTAEGNLTVDGNLDVTGTLDLSDSNFTNVGNIQLDSISGDADTNTSITFSGSDVITVATGGTTSFTVDASQNILMNAAQKVQFRDTALTINSSTDGQLDIDADTEVEITAPTVHIAASTAITMGSDAVTFGEAGDTDIVLSFNANSNDGEIKWMEDEDYFEFSDDILVASTEKIQFRDTALTINSSTDGQLDIDADTELEITAPTVDINASTAVLVSNDLKLDSDAAVLGFGADNDVTLTHVADTGLLLNSTSVIQFNDASQKIGAPNATTLDIDATDEIELNATLVDVNANLDVSGTYTGAGLMTTGGNIVIPDAGNIGSASDTDAIAIGADGDVTLTQDLELQHDAATLSFGADNDVVLTHVADTGLLLNSTMALQFNDASQFINAPSATVLDINATDEIELNATLVDVNANLDVSGTGLVTGVLTTTAQVVQNGGFDSNDASTIIAADGAADNQFALQIQNLESTNDRSYGLYIQAGTTVTDSPLHIYERTGSTQLFRVTGTGQALFTDGSESLPSITNIGDTNTGIFFPAADTIAFSEGGSEAMRIRSTGDVGIGTGGDFTYDDITGSGFGLAIGASGASSAGIQIRTGTSGVGRIYFGDNSGSDAGRKKGSIEFNHSTDDLTIVAEDDLRLYGGEDVVMRGSTYSFENAAGNTNYAVIDSSGNVGIGTSTIANESDHKKLKISGASGTGAGIIEFADGSNNIDGAIFSDDGNLFIVADRDNATASSSIRFRVDGSSEKMRIDSSGDVDIGSTGGGAKLAIAGAVGTQNGSESAPTHTFYSDNDTGMFRPSANTLGFSTSGSEAMRIDSSGNIIAKTGEVQVSPASGTAKLRLTSQGTGSEVFTLCGQIEGVSNTGFAIRNETDSRNDLVIDGSGNVGIGVNTIQSSVSGKTLETSGCLVVGGNLAAHQTNRGVFEYQGNAFQMRSYGASAGQGEITFRTGGGGGSADAEAMRITSSGNVLIGASASQSVLLSSGNALQIQGLGSNTSGISTTRHSADSGGPYFNFGKSRGTADGAVTAVQSGDILGQIFFSGADGTDIRSSGASIMAKVDGTSGSNDMPGRLVFSTTEDGSDTPTERMSIDSSGKLLIGDGTSNTDDLLQIETPASGGGHGILIRRNDSNSSQQVGKITFGNNSSDNLGQIYVSTVGAVNSAAMVFQTTSGGSSSEAMRIDSSGNVLVGESTSSANMAGVEIASNGQLYASTSSTSGHFFNISHGSDGDIVSLRKGGATVGSIGFVSTGAYIQGETDHSGLRFGGGQIIPFKNGADTDNTTDLGAVGVRFVDIFATNGTIQTSDRNEKQDIAELTATEMKVAKRISALFKTFRWKSKVTEKGDAARTHTGIIAQDVQAAFSAEGLDASKYALWCSDTWTNNDGSEQTRMGIRYPELLSFLSAYNEQRFTDIEARITALEGA